MGWTALTQTIATAPSPVRWLLLWQNLVIMGGPLGVLTIIGIAILGLLIIGQLLYRKFRKGAYAIWGLTFALLIYCVYSFHTRNERRGDLYSNGYVGTYKLDIYNSSYDGLNLANYKDVLLIVNKDKTFRFSRELPFFRDINGHWQFMDNGDISWMEISVGNQNLMQANIQKDKWIFSGRTLTNADNENSIVFVRQ